ncbi:hypothetical protein M9H77_30048 [Catharanthus roseus]|uniref:Uncharacterized protein n=1 Tax=Catharanthus roseus TaxID=4058 RepID=A0ACC0A025_CATRO|nr:hypothetical protein M9H77_30048 [Catharanthus roseus]
MLSRFLSKPSNLRFLSLISSKFHPQNLNCKPVLFNSLISNRIPCIFPKAHRFYSSNHNDNDGEDSSSSASHLWNLSSETDSSIDSIFKEESGNVEGIHAAEILTDGSRSRSRSSSWMDESSHSNVGGNDIVETTEEKSGRADEEWAAGEGFKPWNFEMDEKEEGKLFELGEGGEDELQSLGGAAEEESLINKKSEQDKQLEEEEKFQTSILKGPDRAFGDLISASGITEDMLDSLMALKNLDGIQGLPPLREIEDLRYEKSKKTYTRAEIERQKQEEVAKARVRQVDEKGRAYGTGRRKCSIARVWIQPGDGKFVVNDKEFDVYFPMLDSRAALLRPFSETNTLGMWDVNCTVKGGGVSGQVGAIQLGVSKALQNWAPDMRPPLKEAGFLTRDSRVVERKKPGKAKARKSFQWVKR